MAHHHYTAQFTLPARHDKTVVPESCLVWTGCYTTVAITSTSVVVMAVVVVVAATVVVAAAVVVVVAVVTGNVVVVCGIIIDWFGCVYIE